MTSPAPLPPSRGKRLLRRYPILAPVPEGERPTLVRAALRHPLLLIVLIGGGMLLLPRYFDWTFRLLNVAQEQVFMMQLTKLGGAVILPCLVLVPILSRCIVPLLLRREMKKRGYTLKD